MAKLVHVLLVALVLFAFVAHEAESIDLFSKLFKFLKFKKLALLKAKPLAALALAKPLKKLALAKPLLKKALIAKPLLLKKALIAKPLLKAALVKKAVLAKPLLVKPLALGAVGIGAPVALSHFVASQPASHQSVVSVPSQPVLPIHHEPVAAMTKH